MPHAGAANFFAWITWYGLLVAIIVGDKRLRAAKLRREGLENYDESSVASYLVAGLLCGGLVIPVYFWMTRGKLGAVALGVLLAMASTAAAAVVGDLMASPPSAF